MYNYLSVILIYLGQLTCFVGKSLDVIEIVQSLSDTYMLDNTVVIFNYLRLDK